MQSPATRPLQLIFLCQQLYNFFRRLSIAAMYQGDALKRVLDQCWEGHLDASMALQNSLPAVVEALAVCEN
jgi:hypothetical protein